MPEKDTVEEEQLNRAFGAEGDKEKAIEESEKAADAFEEVTENEGMARKRPAKDVVKHAKKAENAAGRAKKAADESREAAEDVKKIAEASGEDSDKQLSENLEDLADITEQDADDAKDASDFAQEIRKEAKKIAELYPEEITEAESIAADEEKWEETTKPC